MSLIAPAGFNRPRLKGPEPFHVSKPGPGIPVKEPLKSISMEETLQFCKAVRTEERRGMCAQDGAATGEPGLVTAFVTAEALEAQQARSCWARRTTR
ncbi:hypothetical protein [Stigmatella aurantiaca]|uniref:Uncharacterized protein n=1 Tax=Stigmatella aurantiaca (strain DW4/3-1) TaxID=378806 RepID=Q08UA0_STIAD|nr:hypothetical protein [Stigmatella aurantiaca]ADO73534.1 uncharacterized protein STAUR_5772 [Stigmatella aurantiaca DW4/3-1]EAU64058.1 hypothetical protein STIAU_5226 [Stigmatella aurantiaca DW4/3-1]